jgi:hypothetical protein
LSELKPIRGKGASLVEGGPKHLADIPLHSATMSAEHFCTYGVKAMLTFRKDAHHGRSAIAPIGDAAYDLERHAL